MPDFAITPEAQAEAAKAVQKLQGNLFTPDTMGAPLVQAILRDATSNGTFLDNNTVQLQLTCTLTLPKGLTMEDDSATVCSSLCITSFGHEVLCIQLCGHAQ